MARNLFFCQINPNYAIHCSAFTINNGRANVRQRLRQAYSPPPRRDTFFPNASHWAELTRPFRALTAVSRQFRIPPWKGGKGDVHIGVMTVEHRGLPLHELPFPLPCHSELLLCHSEHFPCHSERQR